jgi:hypothetical protein
MRNKKMQWIPQLMTNGKSIWLGTYSTEYDAVVARLSAEKKYFGEFAPQKHLFELYNIQ